MNHPGQSLPVLRSRLRLRFLSASALLCALFTGACGSGGSVGQSPEALLLSNLSASGSDRVLYYLR